MGCSITYVLVHMQRKRKQSFERFIRHRGVIGLLFLLKFPLSEFGPVWNLELPNLEVKEAVFLPYFPAYEMTSNFDTILDKPRLAAQ